VDVEIAKSKFYKDLKKCLFLLCSDMNVVLSSAREITDELR